MSGGLIVNGQVSDLGWVGLLFRNPYHIALTGHGGVAAELRLAGGELAAGTTIDADAQQLGAHFLDYRVVGDGSVRLAVTRGGRRPDMELALQVSDARFKRAHEQQAFVEDVTLKLDATGQRLGKDSLDETVDLRLQIPSARVTDMAVYNQYFPPGFPLQVSGGQADLSADIRLRPDSAEGFVRLVTDGLRTRLNEQVIEGELSADIRLAGGTPAQMRFDIAGSTLSLDRVRVVGDTSEFDADDWQARISLRRANTQWHKPLQLDMDADITISDSRPVVAIFSNQHGKHGWLEQLLTVKDIDGELSLNLDANRLTVPHAFAGSDTIDIGAKGIVAPDARSGVFFARWRKLKAIVEVRDGDSDFSIIGARKKFDAYRPGQLASIDSGSRDALEQLEAIQE